MHAGRPCRTCRFFRAKVPSGANCASEVYPAYSGLVTWHDHARGTHWAFRWSGRTAEPEAETQAGGLATRGTDKAARRCPAGGAWIVSDVVCHPCRTCLERAARRTRRGIGAVRGGEHAAAGEGQAVEGAETPSPLRLASRFSSKNGHRSAARRGEIRRKLCLSVCVALMHYLCGSMRNRPCACNSRAELAQSCPASFGKLGAAMPLRSTLPALP